MTVPAGLVLTASVFLILGLVIGIAAINTGRYDGSKKRDEGSSVASGFLTIAVVCLLAGIWWQVIAG